MTINFQFKNVIKTHFLMAKTKKIVFLCFLFLAIKLSNKYIYLLYEKT